MDRLRFTLMEEMLVILGCFVLAILFGYLVLKVQESKVLIRHWKHEPFIIILTIDEFRSICVSHNTYGTRPQLT